MITRSVPDARASHPDPAAAAQPSPPPPAGGLPNGPHARIVITIASMGFFLITLDISIVNVALAQIRAELGGGTVGQQWVIDGYTLVFAALLLFAGNLATGSAPRRRWPWALPSSVSRRPPAPWPPPPAC